MGLGEFKTRKCYCDRSEQSSSKEATVGRWEMRQSHWVLRKLTSTQSRMIWKQCHKGLSRSHSSSGMLLGNLLNWANYRRRTWPLGVVLCGKSYSVKADKSQLSIHVRTFILFLLLTVAMTPCLELLWPVAPPPRSATWNCDLQRKELYNSLEWHFCQKILS